MYKSQTLSAVIAAALVLSSATPAFAAKATTRSADAIPAKTTAATKAAGSSKAAASVAQRAGNTLVAQPSLATTSAVSVSAESAIAPLSTTSALVTPAAAAKAPGLAASPARTTLARESNRPAKPVKLPGLGSADRIADLFDLLPPAVQQVVADALAEAPGGGDVCETLGIPGCQLPDSNG